MDIFFIIGGIFAWFYIGYISTLIIYKITKWDFDTEGFGMWGIIMGFATPIIGIIVGILILLTVVPYRILFPKDWEK